MEHIKAKKYVPVLEEWQKQDAKTTHAHLSACVCTTKGRKDTMTVKLAGFNLHSSMKMDP